jgi:hypothetical protein
MLNEKRTKKVKTYVENKRTEQVKSDVEIVNKKILVLEIFK